MLEEEREAEEERKREIERRKKEEHAKFRSFELDVSTEAGQDAKPVKNDEEIKRTLSVSPGTSPKPSPRFSRPRRASVGSVPSRELRHLRDVPAVHGDLAVALGGMAQEQRPRRRSDAGLIDPRTSSSSPNVKQRRRSSSDLAELRRQPVDVPSLSWDNSNNNSRAPSISLSEDTNAPEAATATQRSPELLETSAPSAPPTSLTPAAAAPATPEEPRQKKRRNSFDVFQLDDLKPGVDRSSNPYDRHAAAMEAAAVQAAEEAEKAKAEAAAKEMARAAAELEAAVRRSLAMATMMRRRRRKEEKAARVTVQTSFIDRLIQEEVEEGKGEAKAEEVVAKVEEEAVKAPAAAPPPPPPRNSLVEEEIQEVEEEGRRAGSSFSVIHSRRGRNRTGRVLLHVFCYDRRLLLHFEAQLARFAPLTRVAIAVTAAPPSALLILEAR